MALAYACEAACTGKRSNSSTCACDLDDLPWSIDVLIDAATDALFLLSGGLVSGRCTTTVRPCSTGGCTCAGWGCACCEILGINLPGFRPAGARGQDRRCRRPRRRLCDGQRERAGPASTGRPGRRGRTRCCPTPRTTRSRSRTGSGCRTTSWRRWRRSSWCVRSRRR